MARIRTLKPEFFRSKSVARLSFGARLTFQGMWCEADDYGRGPCDPRVLKGALWPLDDDVTWQTVDEHLEELERVGCIRRYPGGEDEFYEIPSWEEHQAAAYRRGKAVYPEPVQLASVPTPSEHNSHDEKCKNVQAARPVVLELGTGNVEVERGTGIAPRAARARDEVWDAVMYVCSIEEPIPQSARGAYNTAVSALKGVGASPLDIESRATEHLRRWPNASLTPTSLSRHWAELAVVQRPPPTADKTLGAVADLMSRRPS